MRVAIRTVKLSAEKGSERKNVPADVFVAAAASGTLDETRLERLMKDDRINPERLEAEVAVLADKLDVTEECVRLRSHLQQFRAALDNDDAVGRKLKFLTQEIHREVNTIGSKANDSDMTRAVVPMKEEIEKIREQIRNVE